MSRPQTTNTLEHASSLTQETKLLSPEVQQSLQCESDIIAGDEPSPSLNTTVQVTDLLRTFQFAPPDLGDQEHSYAAVDTLQEWADMNKEISATNDNIANMKTTIQKENKIMVTMLDPEGLQARLQELWQQSLLEAQAEWCAWEGNLQVCTVIFNIAVHML